MACALLISACGGDGLIITDDGVSSGGVSIETITPANGTTAGDAQVVITGSGFTQIGATAVFGGIAARSIEVVNRNEMIVTTEAGGTPGLVDVIVFTQTGFASRVGGFTYNQLPTITQVASANGDPDGGETVTITGTGFLDFEATGNRVFFGEAEASSVTATSDTQLTAVTPASTRLIDRVDVTVRNSNGEAVLVDGFDFFGAGFIGLHNQFNQAPNQGRDGADVHFISATGRSELIGRLRTTSGAPLFGGAITTDAGTGTIYFIGNDMVLYTLDPLSAVATEVGPLGPIPTFSCCERISALTFAGGLLYGTYRSTGRVVSIDPATGVMNQFSALSTNGRSLATNPANGSVFIGFGSSIDGLNIATGGASGTPVNFIGAGQFTGLAFLEGDLYSMTRVGQGSQLAVLDVSQLTRDVRASTPVVIDSMTAVTP